jgi:hypothetical protein
MRRLISVGLAAVLLLAIAPAVMGVFHGLSRSTSEASPSSLACSVKASCGTGEVAVFRMSSTSNAHAGTVDGSSYGNVVCCGSVAGLGTECTGPHDVVLALSGLDNAHVAAEPDATYATEACLSASEGYVQCDRTDTCAEGYSCVATMSSLTNAHVAACDGAGAYATKVCCDVGAVASTPTGTPTATATSTPMGTQTSTPTPGPASVGGIQTLPDVAGSASGSSSPPYAAIAGLAAGAAVLLLGSGWYARRRWRAG